MRKALYLGALMATAIAATAHGAPVTLTYDTFNENKRLLTAIDASTPVRLDGLIPDRNGGALGQTFTFVAGSSDLSMSAGWRVAPPEVRTIGVNIDLFDAANNLVASDVFSGVSGDLAASQFSTSGLTVGAVYTLQFTGTALEGGRYQVDLAAGAAPPPTPPTPVVPTSPEVSLFDTLSGGKFYGRVFDHGDSLLIDGVFGESGSIFNVANLTLTGGPLSGGITWLVAPGDLRTIGVNVDLFDAANMLVASDSFMGVTDGQAFSNFAVDGLIGNYRLVFSGTATQGGRYRINLGQDLTAPGFMPIPTGGGVVPEPQSWALLLVGFGSMGVALRRRRAGWCQLAPMCR